MFLVRLTSVVLASAWLGGVAAEERSADDETVAFFESRIRPVLIEHCYECHNSLDVREGGLAVDHAEAIRAGGSQGPLIDADSPDESLLLRVMRHQIEGLEMPEGSPRLSPAVIDDFEKWIATGAFDPRDAVPSPELIRQATAWEAIRKRRQAWWSFQPIEQAAVPAASQPDVPHPVDRFVRSKLAEKGLSPSPRADRLTLLRRASFALTGLPPTPAQLESFADDDSPDAFERLVDTLLESDAFGERWARHWMDWIRYAESHGSEGDPAIAEAWRYRDYLIRALNADVPYDQLVREHIAGDLLTERRTNESLGIDESLIATAHWRMVFHGFAPTDALAEKVRFTDDAIDVFSKAFLGLTVSCARCHNHKFDPISQADYYALFGILGSTRPGRAVIDLPQRLDGGRDQLLKLKTEIRDELARTWLDGLSDLRKGLLRDDGLGSKAVEPHFVLHPLFRSREAGKRFGPVWEEQRQSIEQELRQIQEHRDREYRKRWDMKDRDGSVYQYGNGMPSGPYRAGGFAVSPSGNRVVTGIYPAGVYSHAVSDKDAGRLTVADVKLDQATELWLHVSGDGGATARYVVQDYPRRGTVYPVKQLQTPSQKTWRWEKFDLAYWQGDDAHFEMATARDAPLLVKPNDRSWFAIREACLIRSGTPAPPQAAREFLFPLLEVIRRAGTPRSIDDLADRYVEALRNAVVAWRRDELSDDQAVLLDLCLKQGLLPNRLDQLPSVQRLVAEYRRIEAALPVPRRVPTLDEWQGHDQRLLVRGNHQTPADPVPRRFLEFLDATPYRATGSGRRQLAEDVVRDDNPLTRRVIVNRIWHHLFGAGLVETPDNFGRLGGQPSHPALLDSLAATFASEHNWSLKTLIRLLVTSETWKQASRRSELAARLDPQNRWLSHANTNRLEAEAIRDALLATSGRLDPTLFGPPVPGNADRRSVYVPVIRNRLDPFLATFDAPVPFGTKGRRDVTTVPAQSLLMMNHPFVAASAARLAESVLSDSPGTSIEEPDGFTRRLWRRALGREPSSRESETAKTLLGDLASRYAADGERRQRLRDRLESTRRQIASIVIPVRRRLEAERDTDRQTAAVPPPIAAWDFEGNLRDSAGGLRGTAFGSARVADGRLLLDGDGFVKTQPLAQPLVEKSLEVIAVLENLDQRGGGVMSVQSSDGQVFDAVVFAERTPRRWLAGSDHHRRTESFGGGEEQTASKQPVHLVITYGADGTIGGYRNGSPYGTPYRSGVQAFPAGTSEVLFGLRHGTAAGGNRMFRGEILEARLYDRPLTADEVATVAAAVAPITERQIVAKLSNTDRDRLSRLRRSLRDTTRESESLGDPPASDQPFRDLAHSVYNLKEFLYVR